MRKTAVFCTLLAIASGASASTTSKPPAPPVSTAQSTDAAKENLRVAMIYIGSNNLKAATQAVDQVLQQEDFERLPEKIRYAAQLMAGAIAEEQGEHKKAYGYLVRATALPEADGEAWFTRLSSAYALKDYADSAVCVTTIAQRWPDKLGDINERAVITIERELMDGNHASQRLAYLQALFDARWKDSDGEPNELWQDLATLQLANGHTRQAAAAAARIDSARTVLSMRVDKRFDALTRADQKHYDVDRMLAREIDSARAQMQSTPHKLRPTVRLQSLLLSARRYDEVLALADAVIAKTQDGNGSATYEDFDKQYIWLLDERSRALARLGRWDEAVEQWQRAARRPEDGGMNVSQIINLGQLYADLKRPGEALSTVQELGSMSPYGRMQLEIVRLEAAIVQQDQAAISMHLTYMREHRKDAITTWQAALLLSNHLDEAADLLIERLKNEEWRSQALDDMQIYADIRTTPMDTERLRRWRDVIARPQVQNVLAGVGRVETFHLDPTET